MGIFKKDKEKKEECNNAVIEINDKIRINLEYQGAWFGKLSYDFGNIKSKTLDIQIDAYDTDNVALDNAKKILISFFENWSTIKKIIIDEVYNYYCLTRKRLGYDVEINDEFPNITNVSKIIDMIEIIGITIPDNENECDLVFNCTWEKEHGMGIRLVKNNIIEIGYQDIAL